MEEAGWLAALEASALGEAARSGAWTYAIANTVHVLGIALLVGGIAVLDLILLRRGKSREAAGFAVPLAVAGFVLAVLSGVVLFAADATALGRNPVFWTKLGLVGLAVANVVAYRRARRPPTRLHAGLSLLFWVAATVAGRMIAYV